MAPRILRRSQPWFKIYKEVAVKKDNGSSQKTKNIRLLRPIPPKHCLFKQTPYSQGLVVNIKTGIYYTLNEGGQALWNWMDGTRTVHQLAGRLSIKFRLSQSRAVRDTVNFIQRLKRLDLIKSK